MSGETEQNISGWTVDTLHGLVVKLFAERDLRYEQRFEAMESARHDRDKFLSDLADERSKQVQVAFQAAEKASAKADAAYEKRFDSVNEFRGQLSDQARSFMPRLESETISGGIESKIADLRSAVERIEGSAGGSDRIIGYVLGGAGVLVAIAAVAIAVATH